MNYITFAGLFQEDKGYWYSKMQKARAVWLEPFVFGAGEGTLEPRFARTAGKNLGDGVAQNKQSLRIAGFSVILYGRKKEKVNLRFTFSFFGAGEGT